MGAPRRSAHPIDRCWPIARPQGTEAQWSHCSDAPVRREPDSRARGRSTGGFHQHQSYASRLVVRSLACRHLHVGSRLCSDFAAPPCGCCRRRNGPILALCWAEAHDALCRGQPRRADDPHTAAARERSRWYERRRERAGAPWRAPSAPPLRRRSCRGRRRWRRPAKRRRGPLTAEPLVHIHDDLGGQHVVSSIVASPERNAPAA